MVVKTLHGDGAASWIRDSQAHRAKTEPTSSPSTKGRSGLFGGRVVTRRRRPALRVLGDACRRLVPGGPANTRIRRPYGARRQRLADRSGDAGRDVSHRKSTRLNSSHEWI